MRDFLASLSPREIEIEDVTYRVDPPTTRQAIYVMCALEAIGEDDDAWSILERTCRKWLPDGLADVYFGEVFSPYATLKDIHDLLSVGARDREQFEQRKQRVEDEVKRRSWWAIVADFSNALSTPVLDIIGDETETRPGMPFPTFLGLCVEVFRIGQRRKADAMIAYVAARTGDKLATNILEGAHYIDRKPDPKLSGWQPTKEWDEEQMRKIAHFKATHDGFYRKKGEA